MWKGVVRVKWGRVLGWVGGGFGRTFSRRASLFARGDTGALIATTFIRTPPPTPTKKIMSHTCELRLLRPPVCVLDRGYVLSVGVSSTRLTARWFSAGQVADAAECTRRSRRLKGWCSAQDDSPKGVALLQMRFRRRFNLTRTIDMRGHARALPLAKHAHELYRHTFVTINPALALAHEHLVAVTRLTSLHKPSSEFHPDPSDSRCGNVSNDYRFVPLRKHDGPGGSFSAFHLAWRGLHYRASLLSLSGARDVQVLLPSNMHHPKGCKLDDKWSDTVGFEDPRVFIEEARSPSEPVRLWVSCTYRGSLAVGPDIATAPVYRRVHTPTPLCAHHVLVFSVTIPPPPSSTKASLSGPSAAAKASSVVARATAGPARVLAYNARRAMEKNWIPFGFGGKLYFTYELEPMHKVCPTAWPTTHGSNTAQACHGAHYSSGLTYHACTCLTLSPGVAHVLTHLSSPGVACATSAGP